MIFLSWGANIKQTEHRTGFDEKEYVCAKATERERPVKVPAQRIRKQSRSPGPNGTWESPSQAFGISVGPSGTSRRYPGIGMTVPAKSRDLL